MHHVVYVHAYTRECTGMCILTDAQVRTCVCCALAFPWYPLLYDNPLPSEMKEPF